MKGIMSRMWRSGLSLLLVLCLVVGMCPAAFATGNESLSYVSLGDSMTNGYGLDGYLTDSGINVNGYLQVADEAYPAQFKEYLEETHETEVNLTQLAMSGIRAEEVYHLLTYGTENQFPADDYTRRAGYGRFNDSDLGSESGVGTVAKKYQNSVKNADVISIGLGYNNFGTFLTQRLCYEITQLGFDLGGNYYETNLEALLSTVDASMASKAMSMYNELLAMVKNELIAKGMSNEFALHFAESMAEAGIYSYVGFMISYKGILDYIAENNPDAEVVIVSMANCLDGLYFSIPAENGEAVTIDMGEYFGYLTGAANLYMAGLPAAYEIGADVDAALGNESSYGMTVYYAETGSVDLQIEEIANANFEGYALLRQRIAEEVCEMIFPLLFGGSEDDYSLDMSKVKAVEAALSADAGKTGAEALNAVGAEIAKLEMDPNVLSLYVTYLGIEKAVIKAAGENTIDYNSIAVLVEDGALEELFNGVMADYNTKVEAVKSQYQVIDGSAVAVAVANATPDILAEVLDTTTINALLHMFARFLVGDGIGCHPSESGYDTITAAMKYAYGEGVTAKDTVIEKTEIALDELYNLVQEYGPEALEQAYAYAVENGYIDQLNAAIDELKGDLEAKIDEYVTTAKPAIEGSIAKLEEEVAALEEELASLKAELEAKKEELANAAGATAEELEKAIKELEDVIATIESTIAAVESKIADLEAVIDELETALANIETELAELGEAVTSLEDACTALMDVLANASGSSVEAVLNALDAARNVAEAAIETVETIYAQAETLYNDLTALAEELGEKALDLYAYVTEQLQAAYDKLPEDVKQSIEEAAAALKEAAEQAKAEILAEAEKKIEELKAELQPELEKLQAELNAIKEQIEAEVAAKAAELEAAAQAKIDELTAAANEKIAELEKQLAEKQAELENAAEELKAEIQAEIDAIQAQIDAIKGDLEAAVEAVKAELEQKIAEIRAEVEQAYAEAVAELEQKIADLTAELEQKIAEIQAAAQAKIDEITAELEKQLAELGEVGEDIQAAIDLIKEAAKGEIAAAIEEAKVILGNAVEGADNLAELVENLVNETTTAIENKITEIVDAYNAAYDAATTDDYVITEESYYVALGDGSAVSQSYVDKVAEQLGVDYTNLAKEGSVDDAIGIIEANADTIAKADLITVGYGNAAYTQSAIEQMINALRGKETVDYDWEAYVGADGAAYVEQALDAIYEELVANGLDTTIAVAGLNNVSLATALTMAVETYAYGTVAYACDLPDVVNAIHEVNPDAVVIIVGMNNPFEGTTIEYEGATIDIGEYVGYLVDAANVHGTAYAMLTGNAIYVEAPSAQTAVSGRNLNAEAFIMEYLFDNVSFEPTDNGHVYIANQILDALNVSKIEVEEKGLWGDADSNGVVDTNDATLVLKYFVHLIGAGDLDLSVSDVDGNGSVDTNDATLILKYFVHLISAFPVEG